MTPHRTPFFLPLLYPSLCWRISTRKKEIFLTFDDGPIPGPTDFVLKTLDNYAVKATFFCIGDNIRKHSALYKKIIDDGHQVGNHTFHHTNGWKVTTDKYYEEVRLCEEEMGKHSDQRSKLFRPPYGRIKRDQITSLKEYNIIMWDVLSVDYSKNLSKESCLRNTLKVVRPGSIVVFHDSLKAETNLAYALPKFIELCQVKGYLFSLFPI
jgi:peptidoglycan/xylan/chitin deacetylase (PgdA/CDA1 family)